MTGELPRTSFTGDISLSLSLYISVFLPVYNEFPKTLQMQAYRGATVAQGCLKPLEGCEHEVDLLLLGEKRRIRDDVHVWLMSQSCVALT